MAKIWLKKGFGVNICFLYSVSILQIIRKPIQIILFCLTYKESNDVIANRQLDFTILQQKAIVIKVILRVSVQSIKLKKYIVGVRAKFKALDVLFVLGSLNSQILVMKIRKMFEKMSALMALIVQSSPPKIWENRYWTQYNPGGVVILGSQVLKSPAQQVLNCRQ